MDETSLLPDEIRPTSGGSYVRLEDGSLMLEADWLAAQGAPVQQAASTELTPVTPAPPPPSQKRRTAEKEA